MLLATLPPFAWAPSPLPRPRATTIRAPLILAQQSLPIDDLGGFDLQRKLGEGSFAEVTAGSTDAESVLSGRGATSLSAPRVQVGLF